MIIKKIKTSCNGGCGCKCNGPKPKGHLDTQLFPECKGTKYDRDIVKKEEKRRKKEQRKHKKAFNLKEYRLANK